jgi:hypothetical protein
VSRDGTHHEIDGAAMYSARFGAVQKFHEPGLAPARDGTGAFHIAPDGKPAYAARFQQSFGFYENLAAVADHGGWGHIHPSGAPAYSSRFDWCGNFQERRCTVRGADKRYFHIAPDGGSAYSARHLYAGDFREGVAVVRHVEDGLCGHVDLSGLPTHDARFLDLDVFHKGFARARDTRGWFHVERDGRPAYSERFAAVEPFYNGQALVETLSGARAVIGVDGVVRVEVLPSHPRTGEHG